ncbi:MAG: hypothetical protein ABIB71_04305 [Candidatus Woesearchaeota archaeon]
MVLKPENIKEKIETKNLEAKIKSMKYQERIKAAEKASFNEEVRELESKIDDFLLKECKDEMRYTIKKLYYPKAVDKVLQNYKDSGWDVELVPGGKLIWYGPYWRVSATYFKFKIPKGGKK